MRAKRPKVERESFCFRKLEVWQSWSIALVFKQEGGKTPQGFESLSLLFFNEVFSSDNESRL